jgi:hypothetical protein
VPLHIVPFLNCANAYYATVFLNSIALNPTKQSTPITQTGQTAQSTKSQGISENKCSCKPSPSLMAETVTHLACQYNGESVCLCLLDVEMRHIVIAVSADLIQYFMLVIKVF